MLRPNTEDPTGRVGSATTLPVDPVPESTDPVGSVRESGNTMMPATANLPITRTLRDPSRDAELSRARGSLRIGFAADARGGSRLTDLSQYSPSRVLRPLEAGDEASAVLINTAGGVCGGDRYRVVVDVGNHARATVTTQAAEKVYRALDSRAQLDTTLRVGAGARLHWAPQETILFASPFWHLAATLMLL